jgi:hypothetical protein
MMCMEWAICWKLILVDGSMDFGGYIRYIERFLAVGYSRKTLSNPGSERIIDDISQRGVLVNPFD